MEDSPLIGIDLGTTNSVICTFENGQTRVILNALGSPLTPSVVSIDEEKNILVGQAAKDRLTTHPECSASEFKRDMGSTKNYTLNEENFLPEELSALVLKSLIADAEADLGQKIERAVITVPAYFNNLQRTATIRAAELAGIEVSRLINEPSSAALAYGVNKTDEQSTYIVIDLGGGTLDVTLIEFFDGIFEIKATAGDNYLGGTDFTQSILSYLLKKYNIDEQQLSPLEKALYLTIAEKLKQDLSSQHKAQRSSTEGGPIFELSREELETACENIALRVRSPLSRVLKDSDTPMEDIKGVILVGGATRMPLFKSIVAKIFGVIPLTQFEPDLAIGMGAAIQAALKARNEDVQDIIVTDVCSYSLGTAALDRSGQRRYFPIIDRNTTVPVSKTQTFYPGHADQVNVQVNVYQGEHFTPEDNIHLGEMEVNWAEKQEAARELLFTYTYDINGVLEVIVKIPNLNMEVKKYFLHNPEEMDSQSLEEQFEKLSHLKLLPREKQQNKAFVARLEQLFIETLGAQREAIGSVLAQFKKSMLSLDHEHVDRSREHLESLLQEMNLD